MSFFVLMTLFHLWDLPGDVLAAPESASGLDRCNLSLSLSLSPDRSQKSFPTTMENIAKEIWTPTKS